MEIVLRDLLSRRRWNYIVLGVLDAIDGDGGGDDDDVRAIHGELRELLVEFDVLEDRVDDRQRRGLLGLAQNDYVCIHSNPYRFHLLRSRSRGGSARFR